MNTETNFMSFENLTKLIEEYKKETHPYKRYEFDNTSYTLLLISINNLIKENQELKKQLKELERGKWVKDLRKQIENKLIEDIDNVETLGDILNYLDSLYLSIDSQLYKIKIHKNQQKEFLDYLENEIKRITALDETKVSQGSIMTMRCMKSDYKEILQKYKSIIGSKE